MPVPPHSSSSSLFSSIGSLFHSFQNNSTHPNPNPNPNRNPNPNPNPNPNSNRNPYNRNDAFESNLVQRLSALLPPAGDPVSLNLPFLKQSMEALLAMQSDLHLLLPDHSAGSHPPHHAQMTPARKKMVDDFLDRSVKLLDVCRAIKDRIDEALELQGMLELVILCLSSKRGGLLNKGQIRRARRALKELLFTMDRSNNNKPHHDQQDSSSNSRRSFHRSNTEALGDGVLSVSHDHPQRWRSWHAHSTRGGSHESLLSRQLQAVGAALVPPRVAAGDVEESFCASVYAYNVVAVFFLSTLLATLPNHGEGSVNISSVVHPRAFVWAAPLAHLHDKVQDEVRRRVSRNSPNYAAMLELDQISRVVHKLFAFVADDDALPVSPDALDEFKALVKQLEQNMEEIERDLAPLGQQIRVFSNNLISSRMEVLDMLSTTPAE